MKRIPPSIAIRILAGAWVLVSVISARAASEAFLKIDGIRGESADAAHPSWIDLGELHWQLEGPGSATSAQLSGLRLSKSVDAASPLLYAACASGKHFAKATVDLVQPGLRRVRYYRITLDDVLVRLTAVGAGAGGATVRLPEQLELVFGRMSWTYNEFAADGSAAQELTAYWDTLANSGGSTVTPILRVSAAPAAAGGEMTLSFPARTGLTYRILGSADPFGPYAEVKRFTVDATGANSTAVPATGSRQFFLVEELP